jgi:anti-sigma regulatory factor (Ser/Thr protein kinase)
VSQNVVFGRISPAPGPVEERVDRTASDRSATAPSALRASAPDGRVAGGRAGLGHAAAVVASDAEVLATALPFVEAGLRAGDLVVLTCPDTSTALICDALGEQATLVESEPRMSLLGSRAPDALDMCRRFLQRASSTGSGRLRVVTDIDFGTEPADWREGQRFESVFNRLMGEAPVAAVCLYDERRLPPQVVASAAATHPQTVRGAQWSANRAFQDPRAYVPALPLPRHPVEDGAPVFVVENAPALAGLRHQIGAVLAARVPDREQREDLHLAAAEIAANAFRHGSRPVSARVWIDGEQIVCAITDSGTSYADPFSGFLPAHGFDLSHGGMGLWLARKLWDHVDLLPGPEGLTVRLSSRLR